MKTLLLPFITFFIGAALTIVFAINNPATFNRLFGIAPANPGTGGAHAMHITMDAMTGRLENLNGQSFDEAFLTEMIVHHEGAIDMAKLVKEKSKREELLELADEIITAQSKEIDQMKAWQKEW